MVDVLVEECFVLQKFVGHVSQFVLNVEMLDRREVARLEEAVSEFVITSDRECVNVREDPVVREIFVGIVGEGEPVGEIDRELSERVTEVTKEGDQSMLDG